MMIPPLQPTRVNRNPKAAFQSRPQAAKFAATKPDSLTLRFGSNENAGFIKELVAAARSSDAQALQNVLERVADKGNVDINTKEEHSGVTALHQAAILGTPETVKQLLNAGADPNVKDAEGSTPLHGAARWGKTEIVYMLLGAGAALNPKNNRDKTPLDWALDNRQLETAKILQIRTVKTFLEGPVAQDGINVDFQDEKGRTALYQVARQGLVGLTQKLLDAGANPNIPDTFQGYPLEQAISQGHADVVKALLKGGADFHSKDAGDDTPLHDAARSGRADIAKILLDAGANVMIKNRRGETPYQVALDFQFEVRNKYDDVLKLLQTAHHEIQYAQYAPCQTSEEAVDQFLTAARKGDTAHVQHMVADPMIKRLIPINAIAMKDGHSALHWATLHGDTEMMKTLLKAGADPNVRDRDGNTPLHRAACVFKTDLVNILLDADADLTVKNNAGKTPFNLARERRWGNVAKLLQYAEAPWVTDFHKATQKFIEAAGGGDTKTLQAYLEGPVLRGHVNIDAIDEDGETALHMAASLKRPSAVKMLLQEGANPNILCASGWNPLYNAIAFGTAEIVKQLLRAKANPNSKNEDGWTPLHVAASDEKVEKARALLNVGADPMIQNKQGQTPLDLAIRDKQPEVARLMLEPPVFMANERMESRFNALKEILLKGLKG